MCVPVHSCREVAACARHCPVPLTAPGSPPAPSDSHLSHHPCPLYPSKPTIINLFFFSPLLLHPSGGPQYTLALPFPFLCRSFFHSYSAVLLAIRVVINIAGCARNPLPALAAVGFTGFLLNKYGCNSPKLPIPISCWLGALQHEQTILIMERKSKCGKPLFSLTSP